MNPHEYDTRTRAAHDCGHCNGRHAQDPTIGMGRGEWPACACGWLAGPDWSLADHLHDMAAR
jgi:hypothetical protein